MWKVQFDGVLFYTHRIDSYYNKEKKREREMSEKLPIELEIFSNRCLDVEVNQGAVPKGQTTQYPHACEIEFNVRRKHEHGPCYNGDHGNRGN